MSHLLKVPPFTDGIKMRTKSLIPRYPWGTCQIQRAYLFLCHALFIPRTAIQKKENGMGFKWSLGYAFFLKWGLLAF
jgi:hypothetical protein